MKPQRRRLWVILVIAGILTLAVPVWMAQRGPHEVAAPKTVAAAAPPSAAVSCFGRIEPADPPTRVGAPYVSGHPAILAELKVAEGDLVRVDQVIATLSGKAQLEAAIHEGDARVALAQAKLDTLKAAPKTSDVAAQRAEIARWESQYRNAQSEYQRYELLHQKRDVSTSELEAKRTEMENARRMLEEAQARLAGLSEVRASDTTLAESELQVARSEVERLRADLSATVVRSPVAGVVLHVRAHPGEEVGSPGIVEIANTAAMYVIAEVYETDIGRVKTGQPADVTSDLFAGKLEGKVERIGSEIGRADLVPSDPAAFADSRIVRVRIRLPDNSNATVARLIHGKVSVVIHP